MIGWDHFGNIIWEQEFCQPCSFHEQLEHYFHVFLLSFFQKSKNKISKSLKNPVSGPFSKIGIRIFHQTLTLCKKSAKNIQAILGKRFRDEWLFFYLRGNSFLPKIFRFFFKSTIFKIFCIIIDTIKVTLSTISLLFLSVSSPSFLYSYLQWQIVTLSQ